MTKTGKKDITRRTLPKIDSLMEWESVFGWAFVETYAFFLVKMIGIAQVEVHILQKNRKKLSVSNVWLKIELIG